MSGEAEKVIPQEPGPALPASSTEVGEIAKTADTSSVANGDVGDKAVGDNDKGDQVTPVVASAAPVEPLIATPSSIAPAPVSNSLAVPDTSKENLSAGITERNEQAEAASTEAATSPTAPVVASTDKAASGTTKNIGTTDTSQKTAEAVAPDVLNKPKEIAAEKVEGEVKNDGTAHAPVVNANGHTRDDDIEMGESPTAPADTAVAKAVEEAPPPGGGKRKADEALGDGNGALGDQQAKPEVNTANIVNENDKLTKRPGPGRPKKQQKDRKILTPVGRTARKTRSQGPV